MQISVCEPLVCPEPSRAKGKGIQSQRERKTEQSDGAVRRSRQTEQADGEVRLSSQTEQAEPEPSQSHKGTLTDASRCKEMQKGVKPMQADARRCKQMQGDASEKARRAGQRA